MKDRENRDSNDTPAGGAADTTPAAADQPPGAAGEASATGAIAFPYAAAGAVFASWFNERVRRLPNPTIRLGAKTASVVELHPDGRLQLSMHASAGEAEEAFVQFEASHLDQLLLKLAALGR